MEQAVEYRRGDGAIVVENGGPLLEGFVGGLGDGAAFIPLADDLEEQIGSLLVNGQVAHLVQNQQRRAKVFSEGVFEAAVFLGGLKVIDDFDGTGEQNGVTLQAGGVAQGGGQMGFADAHVAQEDDIGLVSQELQAKEVLDGQTVDFLGPDPVELFEGFEDREAGAFDSCLTVGRLRFRFARQA